MFKRLHVGEELKHNTSGIRVIFQKRQQKDTSLVSLYGWISMQRRGIKIKS